MEENRNTPPVNNTDVMSDSMGERMNEDERDVEAIKAAIRARKRKLRRNRIRTKIVLIVVALIAIALILKSCWGDIVTLKQENARLRQEQEALTEQRDRLREELGETSDKEYIKEQARRHLKLLDPGEILFIFNDDNKDNSGSSTENSTDKGEEEQNE